MGGQTGAEGTSHWISSDTDGWACGDPTPATTEASRAPYAFERSRTSPSEVLSRASRRWNRSTRPAVRARNVDTIFPIWLGGVCWWQKQQPARPTSLHGSASHTKEPHPAPSVHSSRRTYEAASPRALEDGR